MAPGFFDTFEDYATGNFVGKEEKEELIASGETFSITKVREGGSQWGDKFYVELTLDGEERVLSFAKGGDNPVESRDRMLSELQKWLEDGGDSVEVRLTRNGRSLLLKNAAEE